jgi:hypothetical protein
MIAMNPTALWKLVEAWAGRHWPLLSALGYALAFAVLFGGVALAAYTAGFAGPVLSLAYGALAVWLVRFYARGIRAMQRLIDRLHPLGPGETATPGTVPGWAFAIYMLISLALVFSIVRQEEGYTSATVGLLAAWALSFNVLNYFFARQNAPAAPSAFATVDDALDRLAEPHWPLLRALGTGLGFAALAGGVALHAFHSGFAGAVAPRDIGSNAMFTQIAVAIGCGVLAVVFARLYVAITLTAQRVLIDPWRYVRPEPPSRDIERWPLVIFAVIGLVLFFAMSFIGHEQAAGSSTMIVEGTRFKVEMGTIGLLALLVGWGGGGYVVLRHFWAKARERAERVHART